MLKLDNTLLDELGLGTLPEEQKRAMLQHIYETLELRVGTNLANQMTDQQLEEFEKFIDDGGDANQAQALQWLEANLPNYKQVVNDVFEALKLEVKAMAPQLVVASGAAPQASQPAMPAAQPMQQPAPAPDYSQPFNAAPAAPAAPAAWQPPQQPSGFAAPAPAAPQPISPTDFMNPAAPAPQPQQPAPAPDPYQQPAPPAQSQAPQSNPAPTQDYQFPQQQPPAGPGSFPPQQ